MNECGTTRHSEMNEHNNHDAYFCIRCASIEYTKTKPLFKWVIAANLSFYIRDIERRADQHLIDIVAVSIAHLSELADQPNHDAA